MNRRILVFLFAVLVLIGLFAGFYMTGRVIDETPLSVKITTTDMSLNDTNQNLSCVISGGEILGSDVKYKYKWKKNNVSEIIKAGQVIYSKPSNTRNWGGRESAADSFGNIYTMSYSTYNTSDGEDDVTILKHDRNLNLLWEKQLIMPGAQAPDGVIVDENDDFYIGLRDGSYPYTYIIMKLDSSGNQIYNYTFSNFTPDWRGLRMDEEGNFYLLGQKTVLGPLGTHTDFHLVKLDSLGELLWEVQYGYNNDSHEVAYDIVFDSNGDIYALSRGYLRYEGEYYQESRFIILKIDSEGNFLWDKVQNLSLYGVDKLEIDSYDDLYVAADTPGYTKPVLLKFDSNGDFLWGITLTGVPFEEEIPEDEIILQSEERDRESGFIISATAEDDYYVDNLYVINDVVIALFYHGFQDGAETIVNKYNINGELIENFSFSVDQEASPGIQYYDGQMVMSGYTRVNGLYSYFLSAYFEHFVNIGNDWSNSYKIISDKTNSGDVWTCEGSAIVGEIETRVFGDNILIRDDYVTSILTSENGHILLNDTINELSFDVTCNLGDCNDLNVFLFYSDESVSGNLTFKKEDYAEYEYPICKELKTCDCLTPQICLARADFYPLFNPIYQSFEDVKWNTNANPTFTEWASVPCSEAEFFHPFAQFNGGYSFGLLPNSTLCLHLLDIDEYLNVHFLNWTQMDQGGGFHYVRDLTSIEKEFLVEENESNMIFSNKSNFTLSLQNGEVGKAHFFVGVNSSEDLNLKLNYEFTSREEEIPGQYFEFQVVESISEEEAPVVEEDEEDFVYTGDSGGSSVPISVGDDYVISDDYLEISLFPSENGKLELGIFSNMSRRVALSVKMEGLLDFVFEENYAYFLTSGENVLSFDVFVSRLKERGVYEGKIILGYPLNQEIPVTINVLEKVENQNVLGPLYVDEPILVNREDKEVSRISTSSGESVSVISTSVRMDFLNKKEYFGELVEVDYSVLDSLQEVRFMGEKDFVITEEFKGDVDLDVPSDLEDGSYTIETETKTPDNFVITGKYAMVIEEGGKDDLPFWPTFFFVGSILIVGVIIWWFLIRGRE